MTSSPPRRIVGSYSFFSELENCPRKAYETRIARSIQKTDSAATRWGNYVHDALEKRIRDGQTNPKTACQILQEDANLAPLETFAKVFDGLPVRVELKLGITPKGEPTKFWGPECYVAGKVDVVLESQTHTDITDWKTGKDTYETPFELELHALLHAASVAPRAMTYSARYAYVGRLDGTPDKLGQTYDVSNVGATWAKVNGLMARARGFDKNEHWPEQPNALCGYCPVRQCKFNKVEARLRKESMR